MKVALIYPPLVGHEYRGTGIYTKNLKLALNKYTDIELIDAEVNNLPINANIYHFPYFDPFFLTLPIIRSAKTIVTVHDLIPLKHPRYFPRGIKGEFKWQIQKNLVKYVQAIITDTASSKTDIEKIIGIAANKIFVIPLAADEIFLLKKSTTEKEQLRRNYKLPKKFALFVGDINWNKNLPNIIRAVIEAKVPLILVSKSFVEKHDRSYHPWKDSLLEAQKLVNNNPLIRSLGFISIENLATLYQLTTVLLMPSYDEGFGLPVVEAISSGCPVIISSANSLVEVAGEAAYKVNSFNIEELVAAIDIVFNNNLLRKQLISLGSARAKLFSWKKTAEETYQVYKTIAQTV